MGNTGTPEPRRYVFGNWKMNGSGHLVQDMSEALWEIASRCPSVETVICPPFPLFESVRRAIGPIGLALGGQDVSNHSNGAFTGSVSAQMLEEMGCRYCLVGHSETRRFSGVTSSDIVEKVHQLDQSGIVPALCVGETREERDAGNPEGVVLKQIGDVLSSLSEVSRERIIVAYEPVWAIGSGIDDVATQIGLVTQAIRRFLDSELHNPILLFGGSVTDSNIQEVAALPGVDGVLVGGASLKPDSFVAICKGVQNAISARRREGNIEHETVSLL